MIMHDGTWDEKKERKKERKKDTWGNEKMKMSCLKWDLNPQHSALRTDALMYMYL